MSENDNKNLFGVDSDYDDVTAIFENTADDSPLRSTGEKVGRPNSDAAANAENNGPALADAEEKAEAVENSAKNIIDGQSPAGENYSSRMSGETGGETGDEKAFFAENAAQKTPSAQRQDAAYEKITPAVKAAAEGFSSHEKTGEAPAAVKAHGGGKKKKAAFIALLIVLCVAAGGISGAFSSLIILSRYPAFTEEIPSTTEETQANANAESTVQTTRPSLNPPETTQPAAQPSSTQPETTSEAPTQPETTAAPIVSKTKGEIYYEAVNSVVGISSVYDESYRTIFGQTFTRQHGSTGSGFFISDDGYIVTNYHVIEKGTDITVSTYDGSSYKAHVVGYESKNDIAVIKIDAWSSAVSVGNSSNLEVGDDIMVIGNALGSLSYTFTDGIISHLTRTITIEGGQTINMFQTNAAINSGNSGGPVYNMDGEVIGIASAKYASASIEGLSFCIPINDVKEVITGLIYGAQ